MTDPRHKLARFRCAVCLSVVDGARENEIGACKCGTPEPEGLFGRVSAKRPPTLALRCRSCAAPTFFALCDSTQRSVIVDCQPTEKGNVEVWIGEDARIHCAVHRAPVPGGRMSHHATCPDGASWKRRRS